MRLASLIMAAAVALLQASAPATPPQQQGRPVERISLDYTLRVFAIPFGHMDYAAAFAGSRYTAEMHFRTSGLAAVLWKSKIDASAEGRVGADGLLLPGVYTTQSLSRHGTQQWVRVVYGGTGGPVMTAVPPYNLSRFRVTEAQKKGAVDPLTAIGAIVGGLNVPDAQPCGRALAVFDGRRRYDIVFSLVRAEGAGAANARVCRAEYRQIAGIRQEVVDVTNVPAIYAEFVNVPAGTRHYTVARTIWSSFLWGAVSARLTEAQVDGRPIAVAFAP
ncbi:MAG TPA: DUF3108 domain-containing protein [Rhizomicrobium sp.]|nr:DUF3108 domain-containing protein [Rhizomicrobium sp.]